MYGEKQARPCKVGYFGALLQRKVRIILAGVDDLRSQLALNQSPKTLHDIEHQVFFQQAQEEKLCDIGFAAAGHGKNANLLNKVLPGEVERI